MDINRTNMQALFTGYNMIFRDAFATLVKDQTFMRFTQEVSASTAQIDMPLLEQLSGMREWLDVRQIKNLRSDKLSIRARNFEDTVGVKREDVEDDQYGLYNSLFANMAANAANLAPDIANTLLGDPSKAKWLDGADFFATGTTRKYGKNAIVNKGTAELSYESFNEAYATMRAYKGHAGDLLHVKPTLLLHGPALRVEAADLIKSPIRAVPVKNNDNVAAAVTLPNPNANLVDTLEMDGINGRDWYLVDASKPFKPLILFMRKRPDSLVRLDREEDGEVFMNRQFVYGTYGRAEIALAMPHLIYWNNVA